MNQGDNSSLVIRRGEPFQIDLHLNRPYRNDDDGISFIFTVTDDGYKPKLGVTEVGMPLTGKLNTIAPNQWNAVLKESSKKKITVQITTPANCIVATWNLDVDTKILGRSDIRPYCYELKTPIYILFNPWCRDDDVYMESDDWKKEAILEDQGLLWRGNHNDLETVTWNYGQFQKDILKCSLYAIRNIGGVHGLARANPVRTARAIAAAVNSRDDNGILVGNWTNYRGGRSPLEWTGSTDILQKFYESKVSVKYGQCWVFAGVVTTVCRAVGIPARTITNFNSAHCKGSSLTLDLPVPGYNRGNLQESLWNFHTWNEVWMERLDLGEKFGGWQALDATPQEISPHDKICTCGPASVVAIKQGDVKKPYDTAFVFAEVNADILYWKYVGRFEPLRFVSIDTETVGKKISTKHAGRFERADVTLTYKDLEETPEERSTMMKALRESREAFGEYNLKLANAFSDINIDFEVLRDIMIGKPFKASVVINNISKIYDRTVIVSLSVHGIKYTGRVVNTVKTQDFTVTVAKNTKQELKMDVTYDEYRNKIVQQAAFNVSCHAEVQNTGYEYFKEYDFRLKKPDLHIDFQDRPILGNTCKTVVSLENPLPTVSTKGTLKIEAAGTSTQQKIKIQPGKKESVEFSFTAQTTGNIITANFNSKELDYCNGYLAFKADFKA